MDFRIINSEQTIDFPCGPNSIFMIFDYFKIDVSKEIILKEFKKKTENVERVIMPIIAEVALKLGLKPTLIITNYTYFPDYLNGVETKEIIKYINEQIESKKEFIDNEDKKYYFSVKRFLECGGNVKFKLFGEEEIINSITRRKPCLCQINTASFSKKSIDYRRQHFVVLRGIINNKFILNIGHKESIKKEKNDFLFSLYRTKIPNILFF